MNEIKDAFTLLDRDADGQLNAADLGTFLRSLGRNPTESQIKSLTASSPTLTLPECLSILSEIPAVDVAQLEAELKIAFKTFDKEGQGRIPTAELRRVVTSLGERLTEEEADQMVKQADPESSGFVDYNRFIKTLLAA